MSANTWQGCMSGALLEAGLIDEWIAYIAPMALGHDARGVFKHPPLESLEHAARFRLQDVRQVGGDLRLTLVPRD